MMLYDVLETKLKSEAIRSEMNRYIPETREISTPVRQLFKQYFYDVILYKDRKPDVYPHFDEHMKRVIAVEFFKHIIVRYLRE